MIRFVDLFAGIGGIRLGFEQAMNDIGQESKCVLSSEIDIHAQDTYQSNFGERPSGDIFKIKEFPKFDFLLAGFPCQPFSYAGKQKGFGDTRGTLFFEVERLLVTHQPKAFLLENVRGLTTHDSGRTLKTIIGKLELLGYGVKCLLLNSSDFGVPQNRVRIYIVGVKSNTPAMSLVSNRGATDSHHFKRLRNSRSPQAQDSVVSDVLENSPPRSYDCSTKFKTQLFNVLESKNLSPHGVRLIDFRNGNSIHSWELGIKGECTSDEIDFLNALVANRRKKVFGIEQDGKNLSINQIRSFFDTPNLHDILGSLIKKKYLRLRNGLYNPVSGNMSFEIFKVLDPDSVSITLVTSDAHKLGVFHNGRLRHLTPRECARLQGYPDSFIHHNKPTHAYRQFGNSVSVPVIRKVITNLFENNEFWKLPSAEIAQVRAANSISSFAGVFESFFASVS